MSAVEKPNPAVLEQLLAVEQRRQQALIEVDLATLDEIFDDSLVHVHAPGLIHNKAQLLEHTASRHAYLEITRGDLNLRLMGAVAVITGPIINRLRTADGGERTLGGVATQVLLRDDNGEWKFVSFQMTPYGEQAWPALPSEQQTAEQEEQK